MSSKSVAFRKLIRGTEQFNKGDIIEDENGKSKVTSINKVEVYPSGLIAVIGWCKKIEK